MTEEKAHGPIMLTEGKKGLSIFARVLTVMLAVVVLVSSILTAIFYVYSRRATERQIQENVLQQFATISYHFRYELRDSLVKDLQLLASNPILDDFMMATEFERDIAARGVERFFLESLKYSKSYESISFVNYEGRELVKVDWSGRVRSYDSVGNRPFFGRIKGGRPGSIDVERPQMDPFGSLLFAAGVYKTDPDIGRFGGALLISYNLKDFISYLDQITIFDENPLWLFAPGGDVIKQPDARRPRLDPRPYLEQDFKKEPVLKIMDEGMLVYQDLYINPERPFLRLAISVPSTVLLQDTRKVLRFFLMVSVLSLLVISVLAYSFAGYLSRPITELAGAASRLAQGDLSTRVQAASSGEMQLLIDSFNLMGENLQGTTVSKEYMNNIISSMLDTLMVVSPGGRITRVNAAVCSLLDYTEADLLGAPISRVFAGGQEAGEAVLNDVRERGSISAVEKYYRTKAGKLVPVLFSASVLRGAGDAIDGIVCVAQNITEQKQAEQRLQAYSTDLQEINEELKNFAYIVSHDLRAPLVNIKGFSEELIIGIREIGPLLEKYLEGFQPSERKKFDEVLKKDIPEALSFIGSSVNRMDNLINAILKLSRAGRRKLAPEAVAVQELVEAIVRSLAHQIGAGKVTVRAEGLPQVFADRTALEQIFGNLLDNAVKYLEPGRPGEIEVSSVCSDGEVLFRIRDNGRGMEREDIPKAFEIFRRVGKPNVPGEGMGLAYVKTLVRLHGGRIWCESEPGKGTIFSFTLPQTPLGDSAPEPGDARETELRS